MTENSESLTFDYTENFILGFTSKTDQVYHIPISEVLNLYFIEDIYSFNIVGRLQFIDKHGLLEHTILTGQEYFTIVWGPYQNEMELNLYVYKINDITRSDGIYGMGESYVDVFLVDKYFNNFHSKGHSFAFKNGDYASNISDIINGITTKYILHEDDTESRSFSIAATNESDPATDNLDNYYTGMRTPAENLRWLLPRARDQRFQTAGYLYYNRLQPTEPYMKFNCNTIEYLLNQETEVICEPGSEYKYYFESDNEYYVNKILDYKLHRPDNRSLKKLIASRVLGFDSVRKMFIDNSFTIGDALSKFTILGNFSLFREGFDIEEVEESFELEGDNKEYHLENLWYDSWIKQYCLQQTISLLLKGYNKRQIGTIIEVVWPSYDNDNLIYHKQLSGKYLVKSIVHHFGINNSPFYMQKMICIKNGYEELIDDSNLIQSVNKNLSEGF